MSELRKVDFRSQKIVRHAFACLSKRANFLSAVRTNALPEVSSRRCPLAGVTGVASTGGGARLPGGRARHGVQLHDAAALNALGAGHVAHRLPAVRTRAAGQWLLQDRAARPA